MISAVIGETVQTATVLNPDILPDFIQGKFPRLDIHCVLDYGSEIDVEMHGTKQHADQIKRSIYYDSVLAKNAVKTGVLYSQIPKVYQIMFMDGAQNVCPAFVRHVERSETSVDSSNYALRMTCKFALCQK